MSEVAFVLALTVIAMVIAGVLYTMRKRAERRRRAGGFARGRAAAHGPASYVEPETRFVESPRRKQYRLLNTAEQALYHRLVEAMPNMSVFCQIGIAQLAQLRGRLAVEELRDMIGRSVDFLVCRDDFCIIAAIELSWPVDADPVRQKAAEAKRLALEKLGIPLIVFPPHQMPDVDTIAREIAGAILRRNILEARREQALRA